MTEESLERRCFLLGLNLGRLPPEPELLDRGAYNLGWDVCQMKWHLDEQRAIIRESLKLEREYREYLVFSDISPEVKATFSSGADRTRQRLSDSIDKVGELYGMYQEMENKHPIIAACSAEVGINQLYGEIKDLLQLSETRKKFINILTTRLNQEECLVEKN